MASNKAKRKRSCTEDSLRPDTDDMPSTESSKTSKKSAKPAPIEVVPQRTASKAAGRPARKKKAAMSEDMAKQVAEYVAVHQSDTPEEARIRRKEARKRLNVTGTWSNAKLAELLARQDQADEQRKLRLYQMIPLERSLNSKSFKNHTNSQAEGAKEVEASETSGDEDDKERSIFRGFKARTQKITSKPERSPIRPGESQNAAKFSTTSVQAAAVGSASSLSGILISGEPKTPTSRENTKNATQVDLPMEQEEPDLGESITFASANIQKTRSSGRAHVFPATPQTAEATRTPSRKHANDHGSNADMEKAVVTQHIYIESKYFVAIMGQGEVEARKMEEESDTKVVFSPWEDLNLIRCDITGHPAATAEVKTRILSAVVELRHRHLIRTGFNLQDVAITAALPHAQPIGSWNHPRQPTPSDKLYTSKSPLTPLYSHPPIENKPKILPVHVRLGSDPLEQVEKVHVQPFASQQGVAREVEMPQHASSQGPAIKDSKSFSGSQVAQEVITAEDHRSVPGFQTRKLSTTKFIEQTVGVFADTLQSLEDVRGMHDRGPQSPTDIVAMNTATPAAFTLPENAVLIKIEDDTEDPTVSSNMSSHTEKGPTPSASTSLSAAANPTSNGILPLHVDEDIEAVLNDRRSRIQTLEHECTKLKFMLRYVGISDMQMEVLQQKFDGPRNETWNQSCRVVLGCPGRRIT